MCQKFGAFEFQEEQNSTTQWEVLTATTRQRNSSVRALTVVGVNKCNILQHEVTGYKPVCCLTVTDVIYLSEGEIENTCVSLSENSVKHNISSFFVTAIMKCFYSQQ